MLSIDCKNLDSSLVEYAKRAGYRQAGGGTWERTEAAAPNAHDRANAAYLRSEQAASLLSEQDDSVKRAAADNVRQTAAFAALAAVCVKHGAEEEANRAANRAEALASQADHLVDGLLKRGTDGLKRAEPLEVG